MAGIMDGLDSGAGVTPTPAPKTGVSSVGADVIGGAAEVGSSIIQGVAQSRQMDRARSQGRQLADIEAGDIANQANVSDKFANQALGFQKEGQEIQKKEYDITRKHNDFLRDFENVLAKQDQQDHLMNSLAGQAKRSRKFRKNVLKNWRLKKG